MRMRADVRMKDGRGRRFAVNHRALSPEMREAIEDTRLRRNLIGPFKTAEEAVASMLEE